MKKNKKKVLHLIAGLGAGGAERQLFELLSNNQDHVLCSFTNFGVYEKKVRRLGINLIKLEIKYPILIFFKIFKIIKVVRKYDIKIIHAWMYNACFISILLNFFFRKKNIKILWGIRCSNMNVNYYSLPLRINIFF